VNFRHPEIIVACTITLMLTGLTMIYSNTAVTAGANPLANPLVFRQAMWALVSLAALAIFTFVDYHRLAEHSRGMIVFMVAALALVLLFAPPVRGVRRWVRIGSLSIQVSEFAKLAMVVYVADFISRKRQVLGDFRRGLLPPLIVLGGLSLLILMEPDFGTAVLISAVGMTMLICGGARWRHVLPLFAGSAPILFVLVRFRDYRWQRLIAFLDPWADPEGVGYHVIQSMIALGSGGLTGVGPGRGLQQLGFLPEPDTDFIFAIIGQEAGFVGGFLLIAVFVALVYAVLAVARVAPDITGSMIALGVAMLIGFQMLINIGAATSAIPTKGIALPFVSRGGSSLLALSIGVGMVLNVARHCPRNDRPAVRGARRRAEEGSE